MADLIDHVSPHARSYSVTTQAPPSPRLCCSASLRALDLGRLGGAAQLPGQLVALGEAGGAERMALRQQAAGGIGHDLAAVGVVAGVDERLGAALRAQSPSAS